MKNSPQSRGQFDDPFDFIALHQAQSVRNFELRVYFGEAAYRDQNVVQIRLGALLVPFADVRRDRDSGTTKLRCKSVQLFAREAASQAVHVYGKRNSELMPRGRGTIGSTFQPVQQFACAFATKQAVENPA